MRYNGLGFKYIPYIGFVLWRIFIVVRHFCLYSLKNFHNYQLHCLSETHLANIPKKLLRYKVIWENSKNYLPLNKRDVACFNPLRLERRYSGAYSRN